MCQLELVKIARSKTVSHISDNSIFSNFNLHRTYASLVYVWLHIQLINTDNKFFSAARQKHILFSELLFVAQCLLLHKGCPMKKDNFISKYTWIAVKRDSNSFLFLFILELIEVE